VRVLNTRKIWSNSFDNRRDRPRIGAALPARANAPKQNTAPTIFVVTFLL
jgi:hypothetical protein